MTNLCLYFQVHQPFRIKEYSFLEVGKHLSYSNSYVDQQVIERVATNCYLPTNRLLLNLIERFGEQFKVTFSISGTALEQFEKYCPEVITSFQALVNTGNVELLNETYYHSLASLFHPEEFKTQVQLHKNKIEEVFGVTPEVFRNTELIYNEELVKQLSSFKFKAVLCEGVEDYLAGKSPNYIYQSSGEHRIALLLRNHHLSDTISFRFSDKSWGNYPLTADKYATMIHQLGGNAEVINLFMDYETFGEHHKKEAGIFEFLEYLPQAIFSKKGFKFLTPSDLINRLPPRTQYKVPKTTSWADTSRDVSAWLNNNMQQEIARKLYQLHHKVTHKRSKKLLDTWRKLQTSDHLYYMSTKGNEDGKVHDYFGPFDSPYDAYIAFKNILRDFEEQVTEYGFERT